MTGPFDFLHIKGSTAGSFNELSFDVLDATRNGFRAKKRRGLHQQSSTPALKRGFYSEISGLSTIATKLEVERRKRVRQVRTMRMWIVVVIAISALFVTGLFFGYRFYQERINFNENINSLIDRFIEVDHALLEVDSQMENPLNSVKSVECSSLTEGFPALNRELNAVKVASRELNSYAQTDHDRSALAEIEMAAEARNNMFFSAEEAFSLAKHANQLTEIASNAWNKVIDADSLEREATAIANAANTEQATREAQIKTRQARDLMSSSLTELSFVEKQHVGIDLSIEKNYVSKRIEALDAAIATSIALLSADRAAARQSNDAYNSADRAATELAEKLPASIDEQVQRGFQDNLNGVIQSYIQARNIVTASDSILRAYL